MPSLNNLARSLSRRSPVVVFNARTGKRHPVWAELDSNATTDANRMLLIRPAKNFTEGQRYVVVLRNLKDASGKTIKAATAASARSSGSSDGPGIKRRGQIYRVWSFTVASERSLAGRALHIRDDAFKSLGDSNLRDLKVAGKAPAFKITTVTNPTPTEDDQIARRVDGTMTVPCYLTKACAPGGQFTFDKQGPADPPGHDGGAVHLPHPALGARPRQPAGSAALALRARAAGQRERGQRGQRARDGQRAQLRVLRDRLVRLRGGGHRQRGRVRSATSRTSTRSPTACSRASSTS